MSDKSEPDKVKRRDFGLNITEELWNALCMCYKFQV